MGKKANLLNAAIPLFATRGYEGTTTAQIAAAAGVTEPVIYYNFKNDDFPDETNMLVSACPAKLRDSAHVCARLLKVPQQRLTTYISGAIEAGIASAEFILVPVATTTSLLLAMINGLLRRRVLELDQIEGFKETSIEFCRRSLVKK
ncbi:MAG: TetR family transcriptional regulator [Desulfobacterales bacterium]|nr:TetR family transcriptional regulator [Desulfobacterales bacterium]